MLSILAQFIGETYVRYQAARLRTSLPWVSLTPNGGRRPNCYRPARTRSRPDIAGFERGDIIPFKIHISKITHNVDGARRKPNRHFGQNDFYARKGRRAALEGP
jgi:hypothetical protein